MTRSAKILFALLSVFALPLVGYAEEAMIHTGTVNVDVTHSFGGNNSGYFFWELDFDQTIYKINSLNLNFCGLNAIGGGIDLIFRASTTSGAILASTSISSSELPPCGRQIGGYYQASTTQVSLNQEFAWGVVAGEKLFLELRHRNTGGGIYGQYKSTTGTDRNEYFWDTTAGRYVTGGNTYYIPIFTLYSNAGWASGNNRVVSSSTRMFECDYWYDLDCQITNAISFLFWPADDTLAEWQSLTLASSSPFGYVYDIPDTIQNIYATTSATWQLSIDFSTLGTEADAFRKIATSSVTVFDACWLNRGVGEATAGLYATYVMPMIGFFMWIGVLFGLWSLATRIF